jgi:nucleotide-binding universal stress UspA family protein
MARIVVGADASAHGREALRWALREARLRHLPVLALHAYHSPMASLDVAAGYVDLRPAAVAVVEDEVGKAVADVGADVDVATHVTEGDAGIALVRAATAGDLLVVGAGKHGVIAGALLGSTSQYVTCHAPCPVVVVRGDAP